MDTYWKQQESEDAVNCICKIIEKAGKTLEKKDKSLIDSTLAGLDACAHIPNKLKFFIMDIKDLRKKG